MASDTTYKGWLYPEKGIQAIKGNDTLKSATTKKNLADNMLIKEASHHKSSHKLYNCIYRKCPDSQRQKTVGDQCWVGDGGTGMGDYSICFISALGLS